MAGPAGPVGPKGSTFIGIATITETAVVAILAGTRVTPEIACQGVLASDILEAYPTSLAGISTTAGSNVISNGVAVHHAIPTGANKFRAVVSVPAIALGASYSIPVAVFALNR